MIRRYAPPRKKRPGTRRGQATPEEVSAVRLAVYERASGRCELNLSPACIKGILPYEGPDSLSHGHMSHDRGKRMWGTHVEWCHWSCWHCHLVSTHNPKACPPKPRA